jgi:small-conductance mechanosensitive channel
METFSKSKKLNQKTGRLVKDLKRQADAYKTAVESQNKKMVDLDKRIDQQNEIICQQNARLAEQEEKLAEMSRRLIENTNQLTDLSKEKLVLAGPRLQGADRPPSGSYPPSTSGGRGQNVGPPPPPPAGAKRKRSGEPEERIWV